MYRRRPLACLAAQFVVINKPRPGRWWHEQLLQIRYEYSGEDVRTDSEQVVCLQITHEYLMQTLKY